MKTIAMLVGVLVTACTGSGDLAPDAPLPGVHDQTILEACDSSWGDGASHCSHGCLIKPADPLCHGQTPCNDHPGCQRAMATRGLTSDCPLTFIAVDYAGEHVGCCLIRTAEFDPALMAPTFYECQ
jgi:hypothetical protein